MLKDSDVPMCAEHVPLAPTMAWLIEAPSNRQNSPLSPRVLNQQKHLSPRKRASNSKENGGGAPQPKRFVYDEATLSAMQVACFGLHRM